MKNFSERLRELRKASGITQQELADSLLVHLQTVSKWEMLNEPDISQLGDIALALDTTLENLTGLKESGITVKGKFDPVILGKTICKLRTEKGESQEEIGKALDISSDSVSRWERGISCPTIDKLCYLSAHFDISLSELYYGKISKGKDNKKKSRKGKIFAAAAILVAICTFAVITAATLM